MTPQRPVDVQAFLDEHPISRYQWLIFGLTFLVVLMDGFDTAAIGYIAPSLLKEWGVPKPALVPVLSAALFGLINRALIPVGMHQFVNSVAWFQLGDFTNSAHVVVHGDLTRFFAGDPTAGQFMSGFFPIMMFGLPAAALAMAHTARPERRKAVLGLMVSLALTSFFTGITEPIEFSFMFIAPLLYAVHAVLTALSMAVTWALGVHAGFTFSAGAIDYGLNWNLSTKPWLIVPIGLVFGVIYYVVFRFAIIKFDLPTPGREPEEEIEDLTKA